ncbi:MAG: ABC transporter ATP-binding protein [Rhodospirillaceae bacterium]
MIIIRNLTHVYGGTRRQKPRTALHDLTLEIPERSFCILSGPNGSGKSTLFRILCGLATPTSGTVSVGGHDLFTDAAAVRRLMGVVFQSPAVDKHLSVMENLRLHGELHGIKGAALEDRAGEALAWTDLKTRLGDRVDTLSGGLARQVELAKCLLTRPTVLLLDEPTTGLDPASRRAFLGTLHRLQRERAMTVLMTSHVFSEAENADSVAIMQDGRLLAHDTPAALKAQLGQEVVVVRPRHPTLMRDALARDQDRPVLAHGDELRIEDIPPAEAVALVERILTRYRGEVLSIAIKQPDLDDVFVHVTGRTGNATPNAAGAEDLKEVRA